MATIIEFRTAAVGRQRPASSGCEVIIFPGIRYERWSETPAEDSDAVKPRKRRGSKPRDHLEIPD